MFICTRTWSNCSLWNGTFLMPSRRNAFQVMMELAWHQELKTIGKRHHFLKLDLSQVQYLMWKTVITWHGYITWLIYFMRNIDRMKRFTLVFTLPAKMRNPRAIELNLHFFSYFIQSMLKWIFKKKEKWTQCCKILWDNHSNIPIFSGMGCSLALGSLLMRTINTFRISIGPPWRKVSYPKSSLKPISCNF